MKKMMKNPIFQLKATTVILGTFIMGVACHSYFESEWNNIRDGIRFRTFCDETSEYKCPPLIMETFFVSVTIAFYILSVANFFASFSYNLKNIKFKYSEFGFHVLAGVLILIGAILNLYSANRIRTVVDVEALGSGLSGNGSRNHMQFYNEKITAGALSLVNAFIYLATAGLILVVDKVGSTGTGGRSTKKHAGTLPPSD